MTSSSLSTRVRIGAVIGGLAAALVLTGCGSGDDSGDDGSKGGSGGADAAGTSAPPSPSASASGSTSGTSAGDSGKPTSGGLAGSWLATSQGKAVALVVNGKEAGLFDSGGNTCSGATATDSGTQVISLKCAKGGDGRSHGVVDSVDGTTLKIKWEGLGEETYTRSKDGQLPQGLPTN
ncbi:hypothetical protein [Streptomyces sp. TS71-3]|uniref:hypothetical protein n=1 Tax=Streptomyces sp. TS71-3 TaxID=2733862 RepID=UPI001B0372D8|nr:hypothetical protein [Streptomyces sp. TS71-3]GHJ34657.1 hypothetical protein Sm713_02660 [Streptomyces sp. TS71-3]